MPPLGERRIGNERTYVKTSVTLTQSPRGFSRLVPRGRRGGGRGGFDRGGAPGRGGGRTDTRDRRPHPRIQASAAECRQRLVDLADHLRVPRRRRVDRRLELLQSLQPHLDVFFRGARPEAAAAAKE